MAVTMSDTAAAARIPMPCMAKTADTNPPRLFLLLYSDMMVALSG